MKFLKYFLVLCCLSLGMSSAFGQWTLTQQQNTASTSTCTIGSTTCAISWSTGTSSAHTALALAWRCGSTTMQNQCSLVTAQTYNGTASGGTCSGSVVDTLTPATQNWLTYDNVATGYSLTSGGGATCIQTTRSVTGGIEIFSFFELSYRSGATVAFDAASSVQQASASTSYLGIALPLTEQTDFYLQVCACGPSMSGVAPSAWQTNQFFLDHLADSFLLDVDSSAAVPTWSNSLAGTGVLAALALSASQPATATPVFSPSSAAVPVSPTVTSATSGAIVCVAAAPTIPRSNGSGTICPSGTQIANGATFAITAPGMYNAVAGTSTTADSDVGTATFYLAGTSGTSLSGIVGVSGNTCIGCTGESVVLDSISISPSNPVVCFTCSQLFSATGTYSNGSVSSVTSLATWTSSNPSVATSEGNGSYQCVARGTVTVSAAYSSVTGSTTLNCQSPTFSPMGTVNVSQSGSSVSIVQYTGADGVSPFTFTISGQPAGWSLASSGCPSGQVNCSLIGIPATVGLFNFFVQVTDNIGNTACSSPGCPVSVNVVASGSEDNTYCTLVSNVETVTGLSMDGPANPLQNCNYTAIAWTTITSSGSDGQTIFVCPIGQQSGGVSVPGCAGAPQPTSQPNCLNTSTCVPPACSQPDGAGTPWYCSTIQSAINEVYNTTGCGSWIQLYENNNVPSGTVQNVYTEPPIVAPGNINCGPDYGQPWVWISTRAMNALGTFGGLTPGNRMTPAWAGQSSIIGYPAYNQPAGGAAIYSPMWRSEEGSNGQASALSSQFGGTLSGVRIMGINFAAPHGRNSFTDLYGNNLCQLNNAGNPQCSPGFVGGLIYMGCNGSGINPDCSASNPSLTGTVETTNSAVSTCPAYCVTWESGPKFSNLAGAGFGGTVNTSNSNVTVGSVTCTITSGTNPTLGCITFASGTNFGNLQPGQQIGISGVLYTVDSNGPYSNSLLGVTTQPGTQTGATYVWDLGNQIFITISGTPKQFGVANVYSSTLLGLASAPGTNASPVAYSWPTGGSHFILDRDLISGCDDLSTLSCFDDFENGVYIEAGQHLSIIDSYIFQFYCKYVHVPCSESHAIFGGTQELTADLGIKLVNNFVSATSSNSFFGGGGSFATPMDIEKRRNHLFKPLTWKEDTSLYQNNFSNVGAAWVQKQNSAHSYSSNPTCGVTSPAVGTGVTATCTVTTASGSGTVNTQNGTSGACPADCVSYVNLSGTNFASMTAAGAINIAGTDYSISKIYSNSLLSVGSAPGTQTGATYYSYTLNDVIITNPGSGYGLCYKGTNTYPCYPGFYLTDSTGTYVPCASQVGGTALFTPNTMLGTTTVTFQTGNNFNAYKNEVGTASFIVSGVAYTIVSWSGPRLMIINGAQSPGVVTWVSNFATKGDCILSNVGVWDIKNLSEFKSGIRALDEGNVGENCFLGQSSQFAFAQLITPKNANNACPICSITDLTFRYNFYRYTAQGIQIAVAAAAQGGQLPSYLSRLSIHDVMFDGMIGPYVTAGTSPVYALTGTMIDLENASLIPYATNNVKINHLTALFSTTTGANGIYSETSALDLFYNPNYSKNSTTPNLLQGITAENYIAGGGVKATANHAIGTIPAIFGASNCLNNGCANANDPANPGPSEVSLRQILPSDYLSNPAPSGGNYSGNQITALELTAQASGGTCSLPPTACSIAAPTCTPSNTHSCHPAVCQLSTSGANISKLYALDVGAGYTSAPAVTFSGGNCSSPPVATAWIGGSGQSSGAGGCFDHNYMPTQAWPNEIAMNGGASPTGYPQAQLDPVNNTCDCPSGGYNNGKKGATACSGVAAAPIVSSDCTGGAPGPCSWADIGFVGYNFELIGGTSDGAECSIFSTTCSNGQTPGTGDLHIATTSPLYGAANDGTNPGANVDKVLGCDGLGSSCAAGTPSQYTGIYLSNGVAVLPQ